MTLVLIVLLAACLAGAIVYAVRTQTDYPRYVRVVQGVAVGVTIWIGLAILALLIRLLFTFA